MADYYTHFSFEIPKLRKGETEWLRAEIERRSNTTDENDFPLFDAEYSFDPACPAYGTLWLHDSEGCNLDNLALFVQEFIKQFRPKAIFGFEWSNDCSKPRLDAYGGGAVVITNKSIRWVNTGTWVSKTIKQIEKRRATVEQIYEDYECRGLTREQAIERLKKAELIEQDYKEEEDGQEAQDTSQVVPH